jgi:LacI family transcriptional regulator
MPDLNKKKGPRGMADREGESGRRRGAQTVTMREVAAEAKVSLMTVSRVINNEDSVAPATREAVLKAIETLNYVPNLTARKLAGAEFYRIGLLYNNPSATFLSEFLLGMLDESTRTGHTLVVEKCGISPEAERTGLRKLMNAGVDGVVLPPPLCEAKTVLATLEEMGLPAVAVAAGQASRDMATVRIDNYKAARKMTEHLIELGHRRIGFIKGHPNQSVSDQRLQGFLDVLAEAGVAADERLIEQGYFNYASGLAAADKLLHAEPRPTAIFAANDDMAAAAVATAHRLGLDVPGDISVAGFDDALIATTVWPTLTTVRQPIGAMGQSAVSLLVSELRARRSGGQGEPTQELLRHSLIKRESTAAPPAVP